MRPEAKKYFESREYDFARKNVAVEFCPTISPCQDCGRPVVDGCRCGYCGSNEPTVESDRKLDERGQP